jgi:hypothetical protein
MAEAASERVVILMTPQEKRRLELRARQASASVGEFVRRSIDAFDPEDDARMEEIEALLAVLQRSNQEALAALADAERELQATRDHFAAKGAH